MVVEIKVHEARGSDDRTQTRDECVDDDDGDEAWTPSVEEGVEVERFEDGHVTTHCLADESDEVALETRRH